MKAQRKGAVKKSKSFTAKTAKSAKGIYYQFSFGGSLSVNEHTSPVLEPVCNSSVR
jgi:hypothetical protein